MTRIWARGGHSLLEAIMAMFIFAGAILLIVASADHALQAGGRTSRETTAVFLARSETAKLRQWCQVHATSAQFASWSSYPGLGTWVASPNYSGFETRVDLVNDPTFTPSTNSEGTVAATDRRHLDASLLRAKVQARWGQGNSESYALYTLVGDSRRAWSATLPLKIIPVTSVPTPITRYGSVDFRAEGYDEHDQVIPDLKFTWSVVAISSCGMISPVSPRDGHQGTFIHQVPNLVAPGFTVAPPGTCYVMVSARYWGVAQTANYEVQLQ